MIIIENSLSFADRAKATARVKRKLLENNFPNDVIIKYSKDYEYGSNHIGSMSYAAEKEGVSI